MSETSAKAAVVRDAMLTIATTHGPLTTVADARSALANPKVHMLLISDGGQLLGTLIESDVSDTTASAHEAVLPYARLDDRTVRPEATLSEVRSTMSAQGNRRLAVVDGRGQLLGLLCRKWHQRDFCSDSGVMARRADRRSRGAT